MANGTSARTVGIAAAIGVLAGGALSAVALSANTTSNTASESIELVAETSNEDDGSDTSTGHGPGMSSMVESEFDYLVDMIPHHQEAIDNAQLLFDYSDRAEMREFGAAIIET